MPGASYFNQIIDLTTAATTDIYSLNVGWHATGVKVDNYSCYWIYFRDANSYVPPFWAGTILILRHTTDVQYAELISPDHLPQPFIAPSYFIHLEYTNATDIAFATGMSVAPSPTLIPPTHVIVDNPSPTIPVIVENFPETQDVNIIGVIPTVVVNPLFAPVSFDVQVLTTVIQVTDTATLLPTTALVGRTSVLLQAVPTNLHVAYIGGSNVEGNETVGGHGGIQLAAGMSVGVDADENALIYGICPAGQTAKIIVTEAY